MFHSFIKNSSKKVTFIFLFFTIGCSSHLKESILYEINKVHCFSSYQEYFNSDFITTSDEIFISSIAELKKHENLIGGYNLIVTAVPKSSSGHNMFFNKAILNNDQLSLYFDILQPEKGSIVLTVVTYPMCLLYVEDINNFDIKIYL